MNDDSNADPMVELYAELTRIIHSAMMYGLPADDAQVLCFSTGVNMKDVEAYRA
jgi:hypothetical protein